MPDLKEHTSICSGGECVLVDCVGDWEIGTCGNDCTKTDTFKITTASSGGGAQCDVAVGFLDEN